MINKHNILYLIVSPLLVKDSFIEIVSLPCQFSSSLHLENEIVDLSKRPELLSVSSNE